MRKVALLLAALTLGAAFSESASAHGRVAIGVGVGFGYPGWGYPGWGWGGPWYYPPPAYYYGPPVVVSNPPTTYIERHDAAPATSPASTDFWYYCDQSKAYYPYVKTCPTGWQKISPTPPG